MRKNNKRYVKRKTGAQTAPIRVKHIRSVAPLSSSTSPRDTNDMYPNTSLRNPRARVAYTDTVTLPIDAEATNAAPAPELPPISAIISGLEGDHWSMERSMPKRKNTRKTKRRTARKPVKKRRTVLICALILVAVALAAVAAWIFIDRPMSAEQRQSYLNTLTYRSNVRVGGIDVSGMTYAQAEEKIQEQLAQQQADLAIQLQYYTETWTLGADDYDLRYNTQAQLETALLLGYEGSLMEQWRISGQVAQEGAEYPISYQYDASAVSAKVQALTEQEINRDVKQSSAKIAGTGSDFYFEYVEGYEGVTADADALTGAICDILNKPDEIDDAEHVINIREYAQTTQPVWTVEELKENTDRVSRTVTYISDDSTADRNYNIKKMADIIHGQCIMPGEEWSMNDTAGDRTVEDGWKEAYGIENGVFTPQAGGGICQVSSTLYDSLVKADLEITERRNHTIPSTYIEKGWDSTISTGGPDLCFKNTSDYPVYIAADADDYGVVVSIYGQQLPDDKYIQLTSTVTDTIKPGEAEYTYDSTQPTGYEDITRSPRDGYTVRAYKEYWKDGERIGEPILMHTDYYPAFSAKVTVGTG